MGGGLRYRESEIRAIPNQWERTEASNQPFPLDRSYQVDTLLGRTRFGVDLRGIR